jgi:hypothetical protein
MALMSKKQKRPEKQEMWSDCVFLAKTFLPCSPTCSQIWLHPLVDDRQPTHLPHKFGKKKIVVCAKCK